MATADHVKALIRSHADGDDERFYAIAMQVAAKAARQGHTRFAKELRDLVDEAKERSRDEPVQHTRAVPLVQPRGELVGLLSVTYPQTRLSHMALDASVRSRIELVPRRATTSSTYSGTRIESVAKAITRRSARHRQDDDSRRLVR